MARQKNNNQNEPIRRMVERHLRYREQTGSPARAGAHLDEDQLASFIGGSLTPAESAPLVRHLAACTFCRRATSQLIGLESELGETDSAQAAQPSEPGRVRRLLEGLAARVLPQSDEEAVFAYHAPAEDLQQAEQNTPGRKEESQGVAGEEPRRADEGE